MGENGNHKPFSPTDIPTDRLIKLANSVAGGFVQRYPYYLSTNQRHDVRQEAYRILLESQKEYDESKMDNPTKARYLRWLGWRIKMRLKDWQHLQKTHYGDVVRLVPESLDAPIHINNHGMYTTLHDVVGKEDMGYHFVEEVSAYKPNATKALSPTQQEILQSLANGLTPAQIAAERYITLDTVKTHTKTIRSKMKATTTLEAVVMGLRQGIIK